MSKITTINTIETSSVCNNKCGYCPAPIQHEKRPTGFMSIGTFKRALMWVAHFVQQGTQLEVNLHGVGEPLMNPNIIEMVEEARKVLPMKNKLHMTTNGKLLTFDRAVKLRDAGITSIDITAHDNLVVKEAVGILRKVGIDGTVSLDFAITPNNWGGQVQWVNEVEYTLNCVWQHRGQVMIMWDGRVTPCCMDAFAQGVFTSIYDDITEAEIEPFNLCRTCHHDLPEEAKKRQIQVVS